MTKIGRLTDAQVGKPVINDAPEQQMRAVMSQLDQLVGVVKALAAKLDLDGGVTDTDYAASVSALIEIELKP